jgi:hypothetical protein
MNHELEFGTQLLNYSQAVIELAKMCEESEYCDEYVKIRIKRMILELTDIVTTYTKRIRLHF